MKVRFSKQYDTYSCGAVALMNMHRWLRDYKCLRIIKEGCNCKYRHPNGFSGTIPSDLNGYLVNNNISFYFKHSPNIINIYDHLISGGSLILRTISDKDGHYSFCHKYDGNYFHIANGYCSEMDWIEFEEMINFKGIFNPCFNMDYSSLCLAWFIGRKN